MFSAQEYDTRPKAARRELKRSQLAALLVFAQESHYYLFGYDGGGYVFFQCAVLSADEQPVTLLCRRPDVAQARDTSSIEDIIVWLDSEGANPAQTLHRILADKGLKGERIGIETDSFGLTGRNYQRVHDALCADFELVEASYVVRQLRLIKSEAEIEVLRNAGALADAAIDAVVATAQPGVLDARLCAAALSAILAGGGDVPPAGPLVNSGSRAVYGRGVGGPRPISDHDQILVELAATYRRYNCCIERSITVGKPSARQRDLHALVEDTLAQMLSAFRPGVELGCIDEIHRARLDAAGFADQRYGACGYSLGATFRPSWMDVPPMIYAGNPLSLAPGMVFFPHVMLTDVPRRLAVGLGNTVLVTASGAQSLTRHSLAMINC